DEVGEERQPDKAPRPTHAPVEPSKPRRLHRQRDGEGFERERREVSDEAPPAVAAPSRDLPRDEGQPPADRDDRRWPNGRAEPTWARRRLVGHGPTPSADYCRPFHRQVTRRGEGG